jgi:hypothetical protein
MLALAEGIAVLLFLRLTLRLLRFQRLRRLLQAAARITRLHGFLRLEVDRLVWAVTAAKRHCFVRSACLNEALMAETLFCQHGHEAVLCIGAARDAGNFKAHAWLETSGAVVIGGPASFLEQFTRFPDAHRFML